MRRLVGPTSLDIRKMLTDLIYYVIIGGGTAGLAIAKRLAEDQDITVAVIEAGIHTNLTLNDLSLTPSRVIVPGHRPNFR